MENLDRIDYQFRIAGELSGAVALNQSSGSLLLAANEILRHAGEVSFRRLSELIVPPRFLGDHQFAAVISGIEPFGICQSAAGHAIKVNSGTKFDERSTLGQFHGLLILNSNPRAAQCALSGRD